MIIKVTLPDGRKADWECEQGAGVLDTIEAFSDQLEYQITACRINNVNKPLDTIYRHDCRLDLLDMRSPYGNMAYQDSLSLLYIKAVHDVLGKNTNVTILNSLSKGLFTTIPKKRPDEHTVRRIEDRMRELVSEKLVLTGVKMTRDDLLEYLEEHGPQDEFELFETAYDLSSAFLYDLDGEKDLSHVYLVPNTGYLKLFELRKYRNGVLLRFPHPRQPDVVPPYEEQKKLYEAFSEETQWLKLMGIKYAADLNSIISDGDYKNLVMLSEAFHEKKIIEIADEIVHQKKKIVLIAGPSSSGKTSFAKRLCVHLRVNGIMPLYLGTDDYFINRADIPFDENGKQDFESLSAVDTELFADQMNSLLRGETVDIPEYDFIIGEKVFGRRVTKLEKNQVIVIEGIHGLNPALTDHIADEEKYKIYISPLTSINLDNHHRIPTTDARMIRRMVRDHRTRGRDAAMTIRDWPNVRAGEEVNIFPYNVQADIFFNSQCLYELCVLKKYAEPLLKRIRRNQPEYSEAQRILRFLECFVSMNDETWIANNSIIREFIGGGIVVG